MTFEIEKNIPITSKRQKARISKYPFEQMEVGDSLFAEGYISGKKLVQAASNYVAKRGAGKKFTSRSIDGGYRVWRIQ